MRYLILIGFFLCFMETLSASETAPASLKDKNKKPVSIIRTLKIPSLASIQGSIACNVQFIDPFFGYLKDSTYFLDKSPVNFTCYAADDGMATKGWATYDDSSKKWKINLSPHDAEMFVNAHKTYQIKALNAQGWAVTINDVTGDEQWRQRHLHYCLIKDVKAVCGNGEMGYLRSGRKGNLTPYVLQILRSIEFIDDALPEQPTAAE